MKNQIERTNRSSVFVNIIKIQKLRSALLILSCCILGRFCDPVFGSNEATYGGKTYGLTSILGFGWIWDWNLAEQGAQLNGGHLVTIDSNGLNNWLTQTYSSSSASGKAWIGLHYNDVYRGDNILSKWQWVSTSSNLPDYRNWASGNPRQGTNFGVTDYTYIQLSDGSWHDYYSVQGSNPDIGIYEVDHASIVPISMNLPVYARTRTTAHDVATTGTNYTFAAVSPDPDSADSEIKGTYGSWGGKIETCLLLDNVGGAEMYFGDATGPKSGTITIGTLTDVPLGTPLNLILDADSFTAFPTWNNIPTWNFTLKRGDEMLMAMNVTGESQVQVYAGESLTIDFSSALTSKGEGNIDLNMWVVPVPEPMTLTMLLIAVLCMIGHAWQRRK